MGAAAEHRGNALIRRHIAAQDRPAEFVLMDDLNALPKFEDAGTPFMDVHFIAGHGGWWAECPRTGFGYWYSSLREAVRRWRVEIHSYDGVAWIASPMPREAISVNACWQRR